MGEVITIGLDIAKSVFQVHGVDGLGAVVIRKRVSRARMRCRAGCIHAYSGRVSAPEVALLDQLPIQVSR